MLAIGNTVRPIESQEVKTELGIRVIKLVDQLHAQMLIELDTAVGVFDPLQNGSIHAILKDSIGKEPYQHRVVKKIFRSVGHGCERPAGEKGVDLSVRVSWRKLCDWIQMPSREVGSR